MMTAPTARMVAARRAAAAMLALSALAAACTTAKMKRVAGDWYIDDVAAGTASPHLYWVKDGRPIVVDRQIRSAVSAGCILYETSRPSAASVVFAVSTGKRPLAVATSDGLRPWRLGFDGLRRFDAPATDANGVTTLGMDFVSSGDVCMRAWHQPPYQDDWAAQASLDVSGIKTEHVDFDVNGADSSGNSTLADEVHKRHPTIVDELLRAGANPNAPNVAGVTPLMSAVAFDAESTVMIERLLAAGADIDGQDKSGMTALMYAARYGHTEVVRILLARGADATIHDNMGRTAAAMTPDSKPEMNRLLESARRK